MWIWAYSTTIIQDASRLVVLQTVGDGKKLGYKHRRSLNKVVALFNALVRNKFLLESVDWF